MRWSLVRAQESEPVQLVARVCIREAFSNERDAAGPSHHLPRGGTCRGARVHQRELEDTGGPRDRQALRRYEGNRPASSVTLPGRGARRGSQEHRLPKSVGLV